MVKKLSVVFIAALLLTLTACGISVLDNNRYGKFLQSYITPGFKAQAELKKECEFLAIDPNGNGIYVFQEDNTISYYDDSLAKLGTYEYSGFDASIDYSRFPAASRDIGNNRIAMVPFGKLQWLVLFGDSMTYVEQLTLSGSLTNFVHTIQENPAKPFAINDSPLYFSSDGFIRQGAFNSQIPNSLVPVLAYTSGNYLCALAVDAVVPSSNNSVDSYSCSLYKITFMNSPMNQLNIVEYPPLTLTINVPTGAVPQYLYVNDIYVAVVFGPLEQGSGISTVCALFRRSTGELMQTLNQIEDTGSGHYGFSSTRIYYEKNKRLYAVEVTP